MFSRSNLLIVSALCVSLVSVSEAAADGALGIPVSITWNANTQAGVAGYFVHVGSAPGTYTARYEVRGSTVFVFNDGIAGQTYYFAVSTFNAALADGPKSPEIFTTINAWPVIVNAPSGGGGGGGGGGGTGGGGGGGGTGGGTGGSTSGGTTSAVSTTTTTPSPGGTVSSGSGVVLQPALLNGTQLSLQWAAVGGVQVAEYIIEAGSAAGLSNLYNGSVGLSTGISAEVGPGVYYVRVRARTGAATSVVSNEISFSTNFDGVSAGPGCTAAPSSPLGVTADVAGTTASVAWSPSPGATSYVVAAGSAPGLSDIYYGDVGPSASVSANVSPGFTAYVRVIAVNSCGQSAASAEVFMQ